MQNSKKPIQLVPYEELTITAAGPHTYLLKAPWLSLQITVDSSESLHRTLLAYSQGDQAQLNPLVLSQFLEELNLPFHYILPRPHQPIQTDEHLHQNHAQIDLNHCSKNEMRKFLNLNASLKAHDWNWDTEAILQFSSVSGNLFDPHALLSVVRRFHLLDCSENDKTGHLYELCKNPSFEGPLNLEEILSTIVFQNYYVTSKCQESLAPALDLSQNASNTLADFMSDEEGHDRLLMRALTSMKADVPSLYLAESTKNIMSLLKQSGSLNFLAFCLAVDFFEKPSFDQVDPLAELLQLHKQEIAAVCLQKHKNINDGGEHESISLDLLKHMKPVSKDYALFAIRMAEILSDEMTTVTEELIQLFSQTLTTKQA